MMIKKYNISEIEENELYNFQIFTSCTQSDFDKYGKSFLSSIDLNSPGNKVVIHIVNPNDSFDKNIKEIKKSIVSTEISTIEETLKSKYYQNTFIKRKLDYFIKLKKDTIFIDIKSLTLKDIYLLRRAYENSDLACNCYNKEVGLNALFLRYNEKTQCFAETILKNIKKDSINIGRIIYNSITDIDVYSFNKEIINDQHTDKNIVWMLNKKNRVDFDKKSQEIIDHYNKDCKICVLAPRIDHAYKSHVRGNKLPIVPKNMEERIADPVRVYWLYFAKIITHALREMGHKVQFIMRPNWIFENEFIAELPHEKIYVPHKAFHQIPDERCYFYMQEIYKHFFTLDKKGWAASSSKYGSFAFENEIITDETIELINRIKTQRVSKYPQTKSNKQYEFDVFFPLQIPHDQTIQFHCDYSLKEIVEFAMKWANKNKVKILFKKHPYDKKLKYLDKSLTKSPYVEIVDTGDIHDYISNSKAVFVTNSGVGFEAMMYNKPIITFGRAIYDVATTRCDIKKDDLYYIYNRVLEVSPEVIKNKYQKFIQWYLRSEGVDLDKTELFLNLGFTNINDYKNIYYDDINRMITPPKVEKIELNKNIVINNDKSLANKILSIFIPKPKPPINENKLNEDSVLDFLFIIPRKTDKWILGAICREIAQFVKGKYEIIQRHPKQELCKFQDDLPKAKNYFFAHYHLFLRYSQSNLGDSRRILWYTHPREDDTHLQKHLIDTCNKQASMVTFHNKNMAEESISMGLKPSLVNVVIGAADPKIFRNKNRRDGNTIGFVSAFYERKNPELLLKIVQSLPEKNFILIGKKWDKFDKFNVLKSLPNFEYIETEYKNYPKYYKKMDIFISTSKLEGGPIPLIEAMMSNIVPVVSDTGCSRDVIEHGKNGFIFPIDAKIEDVIPLINKACKLKTNIRKTVEHLSWEYLSNSITEKVNINKAV